MSLGITAQELLREIERLNTTNPDGFSMLEFKAASGHSIEWCRRSIRALINSGLVEFAGNGRRQDIAGRLNYVPMYRIKDGNRN
jgi:predicted transcriptional regulator